MTNKLTMVQLVWKKFFYNDDYISINMYQFIKVFYFSINIGYILICFNPIYLKICNFGKKYIVF